MTDRYLNNPQDSLRYYQDVPYINYATEGCIMIDKKIYLMKEKNIQMINKARADIGLSTFEEMIFKTYRNHTNPKLKHFIISDGSINFFNGLPDDMYGKIISNCYTEAELNSFSPIIIR